MALKRKLINIFMIYRSSVSLGFFRVIFRIIRILTELSKGLHHGGLVLADRLHGGDILRGEVEAVALQGGGGVKTEDL